MILIRDTKGVYRSAVERAVGKDATGKQVLNHLFGEYPEYQNQTDFIIKEWDGDRRAPIQRANMFWAIPFTILCAPYRYIVTGNVGWDSKSALGRLILKATGYLRES